MSLAHEYRGRIPPRTLALRLRESRELEGLDQQVLAEELDVSRGTISNFERGVTKPSKLQINRWAVVCDVDVDWLRDGDEGTSTGPRGGGPMSLQFRDSQGIARVTELRSAA